MKHLCETIFNQGNAIPWMKLPHWEEYYSILNEMVPVHKQLTANGEVVDFSNPQFMQKMNNFARAVKKHNKECTKMFDWTKPPVTTGCYMLVKWDNQARTQAKDVRIIDCDRLWDIRSSTTTDSLYSRKDYPPNISTYANEAVYKVDSLLMDLVYDVIFC